MSINTRLALTKHGSYFVPQETEAEKTVYSEARFAKGIKGYGSWVGSILKRLGIATEVGVSYPSKGKPKTIYLNKKSLKHWAPSYRMNDISKDVFPQAESARLEYFYDKVQRLERLAGKKPSKKINAEMKDIYILLKERTGLGITFREENLSNEMSIAIDQLPVDPFFNFLIEERPVGTTITLQPEEYDFLAMKNFLQRYGLHVSELRLPFLRGDTPIDYSLDKIDELAGQCRNLKVLAFSTEADSLEDLNPLPEDTHLIVMTSKESYDMPDGVSRMTIKHPSKKSAEDI